MKIHHENLVAKEDYFPHALWDSVSSEKPSTEEGFLASVVNKATMELDFEFDE